MLTVIIALLVGAILGRFANSQVLKTNDFAFTLLSTLFVFIMGVSLGLCRSIFSGIGEMLFNSLSLAIVASLGSIILTRLLNKLTVK